MNTFRDPIERAHWRDFLLAAIRANARTPATIADDALAALRERSNPPDAGVIQTTAALARTELRRMARLVIADADADADAVDADDNDRFRGAASLFALAVLDYFNGQEQARG